MKEDNILLPGKANFTDEEFTLMKMLLEDHLVKVQTGSTDARLHLTPSMVDATR